ncbi:hypothetical protein H0251_05815 [Pectobacterium carotovorum]|uniref:hypothetical protein n=1 Tax=Pectobacterium carotovorum TaxID=554 RepID=UPI0015DE089D|nr:hypothetical protein [Pectobacterium carotovorum]MBA0179158.1 hypothetical protein [Pectobacterium carotovorum]
MINYINQSVSDFIEWSWLHNIPWYVLTVGILFGVAGLIIERRNKKPKKGK